MHDRKCISLNQMHVNSMRLPYVLTLCATIVPNCMVLIEISHVSAVLYVFILLNLDHEWHLEVAFKS